MSLKKAMEDHANNHGSVVIEFSSQEHNGEIKRGMGGTITHASTADLIGAIGYLVASIEKQAGMPKELIFMLAGGIKDEMKDDIQEGK